MTDRRKVRGQRGWTRRELTDKREIERAKYEMEENAARVKSELAAEKAAAERVNEMRNAPQPALNDETATNWSPPRTLDEHIRLVRNAYPDWPIAACIYQARINMERFPLMEKAIEDGLRMGNTLREQAHYKHGWSWPSLDPLTPSERTQVFAIIRKRVCA